METLYKSRIYGKWLLLLTMVISIMLTTSLPVTTTATPTTVTTAKSTEPEEVIDSLMIGGHGHHRPSHSLPILIAQHPDIVVRKALCENSPEIISDRSVINVGAARCSDPGFKQCQKHEDCTCTTGIALCFYGQCDCLILTVPLTLVNSTDYTDNEEQVQTIDDDLLELHP